MTTKEKQIEAYNEAKSICERYINYKGDKRSFVYRRLQNSVVDVFMHRMTNFGRILNLPTYLDFFFN